MKKTWSKVILCFLLLQSVLKVYNPENNYKQCELWYCDLCHNNHRKNCRRLFWDITVWIIKLLCCCRWICGRNLCIENNFLMNTSNSFTRPFIQVVAYSYSMAWDTSQGLLCYICGHISMKSFSSLSWYLRLTKMKLYLTGKMLQWVVFFQIEIK